MKFDLLWYSINKFNHDHQVLFVCLRQGSHLLCSSGWIQKVSCCLRLLNVEITAVSQVTVIFVGFVLFLHLYAAVFSVLYLPIFE